MTTIKFNSDEQAKKASEILKQNKVEHTYTEPTFDLFLGLTLDEVNDILNNVNFANTREKIKNAYKLTEDLKKLEVKQ